MVSRVHWGQIELTNCGLGTETRLWNAGKKEGDKNKAPGQKESKFKYIKEVCDGNELVLEFETEIQGKYVNGVDIISFNDDGQVVEFKVMIRPLQAINLMHEQMKAMLESMQK